MHFELSHEHTLLVDTVRAFVEAELYPHEDQVERTDAIPSELAADIQAKAIAVGLVRSQHARSAAVAAGWTTWAWHCWSASWDAPPTACKC